MLTFIQTTEFTRWLTGLKDHTGKARILARLRAAQFGHFGDCETVGAGICEMHIHCGPGYRVYFTRRGEVICLLLMGGNKSTQVRDIQRATHMAHHFIHEAR